MIKNFKRGILCLIASCLLAALPVSANELGNLVPKWEDFDEFFSDTASVINEVHVEANTGGNTAIGGEVKEGEEKVEVEIKSVVNGKEIEPVEIKTQGGKVEVESKIEVKGDEESKIEREVKINDEAVVDTGWSDFWEGFKSFFENLFKYI